MKKALLAIGTLALLASPSLFAVEATQTHSALTKQLQSQQRLKDGSGKGGKKQYKHQYKHQNKYQGTNGDGQVNGKGKGNMSRNGQGNMSGMGQGMRGGKGGGGGKR